MEVVQCFFHEHHTVYMHKDPQANHEGLVSILRGLVSILRALREPSVLGRGVP